jgi:levansucrase
MPENQMLKPKADRVGVCRWQPEAAAFGDPAHWPIMPSITSADLISINPGLLFWDIWPIQLDNGSLASIASGDLWVMLSAPNNGNPDDRHNVARMRLLHRANGQWRDCGPLLPDNFSPGSREWSGSTRFDPATGQITLWYTAAGRPGNATPDFEQRLFHAVGTLDLDGPHPVVENWTCFGETVQNDGRLYADTALTEGMAGSIKGFRDPYWFRDPADGRGYLLFTGSKSAATSMSSYDGVIGIAQANDPEGLAPFTLLPPLIDGDGLANELERPHVFVHEGLYYLFWSTHRHVFAPDGNQGPTGLYGMVAPSLFGPYEPLNGSGLVLTNPPSKPCQAYAWQVIPTSLQVISFVDYWGLNGRELDAVPDRKAAHFGGTVAPFVRIMLDGKTSSLDEGAA